MEQRSKSLSRSILVGLTLSLTPTRAGAKELLAFGVGGLEHLDSTGAIGVYNEFLNPHGGDRFDATLRALGDTAIERRGAAHQSVEQLDAVAEKGRRGRAPDGETSTGRPLRGQTSNVPPIAFNVFGQDTEFVLPVGKIGQVQRRSRRAGIGIVAREIVGVEDVVAIPLGDRRVVGFLRQKKPSSREGIVGLLGAPKRSLP